MPRKRNNSKLVKIKKQKELIQKRLMQISLVVDEYVYNHKVISTREAEAYIQEVMGCQDKCTNDRRSLQVIEKLVRCLKGIIEEQNECQALNGDVTLAEDDKMDEDITPLTVEIQAIDAELNKTSTNKTANNVFLTKHVNVHENTPIDLSVNFRHVTEAVKHKNDEIAALDTAISELTIQENNALSVETNNLETYSQSVLEKFNSNDTVINSYKNNENLDRYQMEIDNDVQATTETELEKTKPKDQPNTSFFANSEDLKVTMQINNISSEIVKSNQNTGKRKLLNVISLANNIADVRTTEFTANTQEEMLTNPVKKTVRKPRKITRQVNKDPGKVTKQRRKKTTLTKDDNKNKEELRNNTHNMTNKNGNNKTKCELKLNDAIVLPENITQNFETKVINNNIPQNEFSDIHLAPANSIDLYDHRNTIGERNTNRNDVNDLSWIEHIRYVREVSLEENMPSYYEDNFWNSYTLPNDWNNSEFL